MNLSSVSQSAFKHASFDSEGVAFAIDNSTTAHMYNDTNIFKNMTLHGENKGPSVVTVVPKG